MRHGIDTSAADRTELGSASRVQCSVCSLSWSWRLLLQDLGLGVEVSDAKRHPESRWLGIYRRMPRMASVHRMTSVSLVPCLQRDALALSPECQKPCHPDSAIALPIARVCRKPTP